jgi:hypothetical protein
MALTTAALLLSNSNRHRTIRSRPRAAKEAAVVVAAKGDSSNSAMAISVTPASAATIVTMDVAGAISGDAADSVRRTDHAAVEAVVVVAAAVDRNRYLAHRSLR